MHDHRNRIDRSNGKVAVRIHDNDIHHNQRIGEGYGVEVSDGAYARVEKNSFDDNRHAIAVRRRVWDRVLLLSQLRGHRRTVTTRCSAVSTPRPHQVDMHGQDDCWCADGYCGTAGEYMDIRYNSITYTAGTAIKLRGTPAMRMDVTRNVFAHSDVWGNWVVDYGAMEQTDGLDGIQPVGQHVRCEPDDGGLPPRLRR